MSSREYFARAQVGDEILCAASRRRDYSGEEHPRGSWIEDARGGDLDVSFRLGSHVESSLVEIVSSFSENSISRLVSAGEKAGFAESASVFDEMTGVNGFPFHLRVNQDGYTSGGFSLATDFRFFPELAGNREGEKFLYQIAIRRFRPERELERAAKKYLARLKLDRPFPEGTLAVQCALAERLLQPGWIGQEYLMCESESDLDRLRRRIGRRFENSASNHGFGESPVESGDFSGELSLGLHSLASEFAGLSLPAQGASLFSEDEIDWIASSRNHTSGSPGGKKPQIFLSHASSDFVVAESLCRDLENAGWRCWIAPRDINSTGLAYTEAIPKAIDEIGAMVVMLSPSANRSVHIPREVDMALSRNLPIIPLRLSEVSPEGQLNYLLRTCQWLEAFDRPAPSWQKELTNRLRVIGL